MTLPETFWAQFEKHLPPAWKGWERETLWGASGLVVGLLAWAVLPSDANGFLGGVLGLAFTLLATALGGVLGRQWDLRAWKAEIQRSRLVHSQSQICLDRFQSSREKLKQTEDHLGDVLEKWATESAHITHDADEILKLVSGTAQSATDADQLSIKAINIGDKGKRVVTELESCMGELHLQSRKIEEITEIIRSVTQKTKIINDIVLETRLLSFNASIEAAHAGAHGRGFSVVAAEVSKLAAMSGKAALEINSILQMAQEKASLIVEDTQDQIRSAQKSSDECLQTFDTMNEQLLNLNCAISIISSSTSEQTHIAQRSVEGNEKNMQLLREAQSALNALEHLRHEWEAPPPTQSPAEDTSMATILPFPKVG